MKKMNLKHLLLPLSLCLFLYGCSTDEIVQENETLNAVFATSSGSNVDHLPAATKNFPANLMRHDIAIDLETAVAPSPCGLTPFDAVISESVDSNLDALGADWFFDYADMNFYYTLTDESPQYFGANGEYTNLVKKITRNLESFWNMTDEVTVRGQHNSTLDDKDKIFGILTFWFGFPEPLAEFYADYFVDFINVESTFLVETPLLSFDGFAIALGGILGQGDLIVIGDGIVELLSESGVEDKVVWNGIMAHEWAHHIQFNNFSVWYPDGAADNEPEATRTTELEADYFTGYYLTHKRGGTYNWKRVEDFLELFFNIGDCGFTNSGHHGTPIQRLRAAYKGYELAKEAKKNGHILPEDEVHTRFLNELDDIVYGDAATFL